MSNPTPLPRHLTPGNYLTIAGNLAKAIKDKLSEALKVTVKPAGTKQFARFEWTAPQADDCVRLIFEILRTGVFISLYIGVGDISHSEGRVAFWELYQDLRLRSFQLTARGRLWHLDGTPYGDPYDVHLDHSLARTLPGYDPTLREVLEDILEQTEWWLAQRHPLPATG